MDFVRDVMTNYPKSLARAVERHATRCLRVILFVMAAEPNHAHVIIAVTALIQVEGSLMGKLFVQNVHTDFL